MKNKKINQINPVVAGAAIAVAGVAAAVLSKKENRKKAGKVLKKLKVKGEEVQKRAEENIGQLLKEEEKIHKKAKSFLTTTGKGAGTKVKVSKKEATPKKSISTTK